MRAHFHYFDVLTNKAHVKYPIIILFFSVLFDITFQVGMKW